MNAIAKFGGGLALVAVAVVIGNNAIKADRAEAISRFALTEQELPIMKACEATMSRYNIEFVSGVENITGCGCIARQIADAAPASDFPAVTAVAQVVISGGDSETTPAALEAAMLAAQAEHGLSVTSLDRHIDLATKAIGHCAKPESHLSEAQLAEAEAERRKKYEKTKVALDQMVASGRMTRAEADRRLASMQ